MKKTPKPNRSAPPKKTNRRDQILSATEKLILSHGLSGVTTRQIAEAAGCSEGAIYVHFEGRVDLLVAVLEASLPEMLKPLHLLKNAVGRDTPQANLEHALRGIFSFQRRIIPMLASVFAEPALLAGLRKSLARQGTGPHRGIATLASYLKAEQDLGRLEPGLDADMAATLLMSAPFFRAFTEKLFGRKGGPGADSFLKKVVVSVLSPQG